MKIRKVTALIDTTGPDISGEEIAMLANTSHLVFERDVPYFQAHPDAFTVDAAVATVEDLIGTLLVDLGLDATPEELDRLDGASAANDTTGKAAVLGTGGAMTLAGALTHQVPALTSSGLGTDGGGTITTVEQGDGVIHKTILTLTGTPITLTDDAGAGQYGAVKLYDMPAGNIHVFGAVVDADVTLAETWWTDTAEGDVGLGTTAVTNGDALATTEQNIVPTTAIPAMTATIVGTDANGRAQTETGLALPNGVATVTSTKYFKTVESVTPSATIGADTMDIGWAADAVTPWIDVLNDKHPGAPFNLGFAVAIDSGSPTYSIQNSYDDSAAFTHATIAAKTDAQQGSITVPCSSVRVLLTAAGGISLTLVQ